MKSYKTPSIKMILIGTEDVLGVSIVGNLNNEDDNINSWNDLFGGKL